MVDLLVAGFILISNFGGANLAPSFTPDTKPASSLSCPEQEAITNIVTIKDGAQVNKAIYLQTSLMLSDAKLAGLKLSITSSYRTCQQQMELRKVNCETIKAEEIFTKPAEQCKTPTEIPGQSLHNQALALDLACEGTAKFEESPCYAWVKQNAAKYGFKQHKLEQWHWSPTGE